VVFLGLLSKTHNKRLAFLVKYEIDFSLDIV